MREFIDLFESSDPHTQLAHEVAEELLAEAGVSAMDYNTGRCMEYADELASRDSSFDSLELGNFYNHPEGSDCHYATGFGEKWLATFPEWQPPSGLTWDDLYHQYGFDWTGMHVWAFCAANRLCYDIEAPDGVSNVLDLPFFQRIIAHGPHDPSSI